MGHFLFNVSYGLDRTWQLLTDGRQLWASLPLIIMAPRLVCFCDPNMMPWGTHSLPSWHCDMKISAIILIAVLNSAAMVMDTHKGSLIMGDVIVC